MINEIVSDIIHDLIMNIDNRNLNDEELTIHGDINNNHETINSDDDVVLVANYTQADSSYEPEVITLSSDEEPSHETVPSPFDEFMTTSSLSLTAPKPRRTHKRGTQTSNSIKIVVSTNAKVIKSCLKKENNPPSLTSKIVRFNPVGSVTFIPSIDEQVSEKQIKSQSRSKSINEYPYELNLRVNRSVSKPRLKYMKIFTHVQVIDEISNSPELSDPILLKSTINRSTPKLTIKPEDALLPGKLASACTQRWPTDSTFAVNLDYEPFGENIPMFIPKIHQVGILSSINLPEVSFTGPFSKDAYLNYNSLLLPSDDLSNSLEYYLPHLQLSDDTQVTPLPMPRLTFHPYRHFTNEDFLIVQDPATNESGISSLFIESQSSPSRYDSLSPSTTPIFKLSTPPRSNSTPINNGLLNMSTSLLPTSSAKSGLSVSVLTSEANDRLNNLTPPTFSYSLENQSSRHTTIQDEIEINELLSSPTPNFSRNTSKVITSTPVRSPTPTNRSDSPSLPTPSRSTALSNRNDSHILVTPPRNSAHSSTCLSSSQRNDASTWTPSPPNKKFKNTNMGYKSADISKETHYREHQSRATITFEELCSQSENNKPKKSRSNGHVYTPMSFDETEPDCINPLLGLEFYSKYTWVDKKSIQFAPSQYKDMIATMGDKALEIIEKFAKWFHFILPAVIDDRKNWCVTKNGVTYVSTSMAYRPGAYFLNKHTVLDLCLICNKVITHKFAVVCAAIVWKEHFTAQDIMEWTSQKSKRRACYIHWRDPSAVLTKERNPYKLKNRKRSYSSQTSTSSSGSPPQLGPAVLPLEFI